MEFVASLENGSMFGNESERPLLHLEQGALLNADFGALGGPAKCGKDRDVRIEPHPVIAPVPGGDHPAVKVEDALKLFPVERRNRPPVPRMRKRRNHTQALLTFGCG